MDIEEVAHETPEKIATVPVDPAAGYCPYVGRRLAAALKLDGELAEAIRGSWSAASTGPSPPRT